MSLVFFWVFLFVVLVFHLWVWSTELSRATKIKYQSQSQPGKAGTPSHGFGTEGVLCVLQRVISKQVRSRG